MKLEEASIKRAFDVLGKEMERDEELFSNRAKLQRNSITRTLAMGDGSAVEFSAFSRKLSELVVGAINAGEINKVSGIFLTDITLSAYDKSVKMGLDGANSEEMLGESLSYLFDSKAISMPAITFSTENHIPSFGEVAISVNKNLQTEDNIDRVASNAELTENLARNLFKINPSELNLTKWFPLDVSSKVTLEYANNHLDEVDDLQFAKIVINCGKNGCKLRDIRVLDEIPIEEWAAGNSVLEESINTALTQQHLTEELAQAEMEGLIEEEHDLETHFGF